MAKLKKIKSMPELAMDEPNLLHIQESYLRQVANERPFTAKKKNKSEVRATGAKWFRQKGTGRARQGERTNPHLHGGGLAFPPRPRHPMKRLNKKVRVSALRSAVLSHVLDESAYSVSSKKFDEFAKTREVAEVLAELPGSITLVVPEDARVWLAARNLVMVRLTTPRHLGVRDLVETEYLVFSPTALDEYKQQLSDQTVVVEGRAADEPEAEPVAAGEDASGGEE